jgi:uncharacterized protein
MLSRAADLVRCLTSLAILVGLATAFALGAVDVNSLPKPTGYVSDLANVIDQPDKDRLEELCRQVDQQLGVQFAFLTVDSIGDRPIRDFGLDVGRKWGVGSKATNQGLLTILAIQDRQNDIEVGRGLEPYVTDGFAGSVRRAMAPYLRSGQYGPALLGAAQTFAQHIAEGKGIAFTFEGVQPLPQPQRERRGGGGFPGWLIVLGIFFLFWIIGRGGRRGGRGGGGGLGSFATGMLVGDLLSGGRRGGSWNDGGGGGGFGGDSGGGGFGGFGGGDFGGGGASGNW